MAIMRRVILCLALFVVAVDAQACTEDVAAFCDTLALCDPEVTPLRDISFGGETVQAGGCFCPEGMIGNGCTEGMDCGGGVPNGCTTDGYTARVTFKLPSSSMFDTSPTSATTYPLGSAFKLRPSVLNSTKREQWALMFDVDDPVAYKWEIMSMHHEITVVQGEQYLSINLLSASTTRAESFCYLFNEKRDDPDENLGEHVFGGSVWWGCKVYRWAYQTTAGPVQIQATGMDVDMVSFMPNCAQSGCWVIDVTYTAGHATNNFNTFFLPRVQDGTTAGTLWQEDLSYDQNFDNTDVGNSFFPKNFPCGSNVDKDSNVWGFTSDSHFTSTCCMQAIWDNYRPIVDFRNYFFSKNVCPADTPKIVSDPGEDVVGQVDFPPDQNALLVGRFDGMGTDGDPTAWAEYVSVMDPYIGQHKARIYIDEVDLRRRAGILKGTVGVEYTVDTFLGYANFRPTGGLVLDSAAMQVAIHVEKTSFFSVSTEGTNAYTFLEYVNLRLVRVYDEDADWTETVDEFGNRFDRTSSDGAADYVQVTFTMGEQYTPNLNGGIFAGGLIPLDSVRAGKGTFFDDADMVHKCVNYMEDAANFWYSSVEAASGRRRGAPADSFDAEFEEAMRNSNAESGSKDLRRLDSQANAFALNRTWGPLDSCAEQSRCMYMDFRQNNDGKCGADCEYEVCVTFDDEFDTGACRAYTGADEMACTVLNAAGVEVPAYDWSCWPPFAPGCSCPEWNPEQPTGEFDLVPGFGVTFLLEGYDPTSGWRCIQVDRDGCFADGPGDVTEEFYGGNLFQWCDLTEHECPGDQDYGDPNVEYFQKTGAKNVSRGSTMCQSGKPGQTLWFVMRDGNECIVPERNGRPEFKVGNLQRQLWRNAAGANVPSADEAVIRCENRGDQNEYCPSVYNTVDCPTPFDPYEPCGCLQSLDIDGVPDAHQSGFDTCTDLNGGGDGNTQNVDAECVWTVKLPAHCSDFCSCGHKDGECIPCRPNQQCPQLPGLAPPVIGAPAPPEPGCCPPFKSLLCQSCAPQADMCISPQSTPDHFVSFNIPLGMDWYPEPSDTLDQNVFVHMVINALDYSNQAECPEPNAGCEPLQVKTTLSGSIPVVEGGINIFCDGVRAKADLLDVANVDIVLGTAMEESELSRLRILQNIGSTNMQPFTDDTARIDSDSIEAGFMTFVVKGNYSYFDQDGTSDYGLELEDLVTIHIMEPGSAAYDEVNRLLAMDPEDNYDSTNVLATEGYGLNGAFEFEIDRIENRAYLEPTEALLATCPFNPPRPTLDVPFPTTCVTRRDVRYRGFPARIGGSSTAMEVVPLASADPATCVTGGADSGNCKSLCTLDQNAKFMQTVLGSSTYSDDLGRAYSCLIAKKYDLDGRFRRAWWINPNYEWTPVQTGGAPLFTISQKIFLFALVNLNEQFSGVSTPSNGATVQEQPVLPARRRMLLSSTQDQGAGLGSAVVTMETDPRSMIASAFGVPVDRVATWEVTLSLSAEEACLGKASPVELQKAIRGRLTELLEQDDRTVTRFTNVLVSQMQFDLDGVSCPAARRRNLLSSPTATVEMMVVFAEGGVSMLDEEAFSANPEIQAVTPKEVSPKVKTAPDESVGGLDWGSGSGTDGEGTEESGSGSNMAIIAGCAAGGAILLLGGGAMLWYFNKKPTAEAEVASALPDLAALKSQLSTEAGM